MSHARTSLGRGGGFLGHSDHPAVPRNGLASVAPSRAMDVDVRRLAVGRVVRAARVGRGLERGWRSLGVQPRGQIVVVGPSLDRGHPRPTHRSGLLVVGRMVGVGLSVVAIVSGRLAPLDFGGCGPMALCPFGRRCAPDVLESACDRSVVGVWTAVGAEPLAFLGDDGLGGG